MYTERELDRLVVFSGDRDLPTTAYRYATRVESLKRGFGICQLTILKKIEDRVMQTFPQDLRHDVIRDMYRSGVDIRNDVKKMLRLVELRLADPNHPDRNMNRKVARHHAVFMALRGTEFAYDRDRTRQYMNVLLMRIERREISGTMLIRLASALHIPIYRDVDTVLMDLL